MKVFTKWSESSTRYKVVYIVSLVVAFYVVANVFLWVIPTIGV